MDTERVRKQGKEVDIRGSDTEEGEKKEWEGRMEE